MIVIGAGAYALIYVVMGGSWFKTSEKAMSRLQGCYAVSGEQLFRISGRTIITDGRVLGFQGAKEKDGDVLMLDGPLRVARRPQLMLLREGTVTKVSILYGHPLRLELWDENDQRVEATQTSCS